MSIRLRLWLSYLLILGLLVVLMGLVYGRLQRIRTANEINLGLTELAERYSELFVEVEFSISSAGMGKEKTSIQSNIQKLEREQEDLIHELAPLLDDPTLMELTKARDNCAEVQKRLRRLVGLVASSDPGEYGYGGTLLDAVDQAIKDKLKTLQPIAQISSRQGERIRQDLEVAFWGILGAIGVVGLVVLILSVRLPRQIGAPLGQLLSMTRRVTAGDLTTPPDLPKTPDEFGELAGSLLVMVKALGDYKTNMEDLVEQRTKELTKANESLQLEITNRVSAQKSMEETHHSLMEEAENRLRAQMELEEANLSLKEEIDRRIKAQKEREALHKEMLEKTRLAGMAEVATSMLHNVGNLLNSVDVSTGMVTRSVQESRVENLGKVLGLFEKSQDTLGQWVKESSDGKQIVAYLHVLTLALSREREENLKELAWLRKNLAHIREIISRQQAYAKVSGVPQPSDPVELMEHALKVNEGTIKKFHIRITTDYEEMGQVTLEPQKVLQILVNLVVNALDAMRFLPQGVGHLQVKVKHVEPDRLRFSVQDNGTGIEPEHLPRLFTFGFTTKEKGHGVGLHSAALTARDMDGALFAESDGPGFGACFSLDLPYLPVA